MLRIVGLQRSECADSEFVLLQNQGALRVVLFGHAIASERAIASGDLSAGAFVFSQPEVVAPGLYVLLVTGEGEPHWVRTRDGAHVYQAYAGRKRPIWNQHPGALHLLSPQHAYADKTEILVLR